MSQVIQQQVKVAIPALNGAHAEALSALMEEYLGQAAMQLDLVRRHREAVSRADGPGMERCTQEQKACAQRLALLEQRRMSLVRVVIQQGMTVRQAAGLTLAGSTLNPTFSELVAKCPEALRAGLMKRAADVKRAFETVAAEQAVLRQASQTLLSHMQGLMERVSRSLSHTGNYRRPGTAGVASALVVSGMDVVS